MSVMGDVFIGSEAITAGRLTRHELQRWYQPMFRGVYVSRRSVPTLWDRTVGAWLATRRHGVIAGNAASALHGAQWVDVDVAIELISPTTRPQHGLVIRRETLCDDEITRVVGLPVTTLARTAYDLGRHLSRGEAVARLDALMRATPFSRDDVLLLAKRHAGARGVRRLRDVLPLVDGGAASPKETWLRLLLIDAGLPVPTTQIPVVHRWRNVGVLDMGWEKYMVAAEYDGDQHRSDRGRYVKDQRRLRKLAELGWIVIRVIAEDNPDDVVNRVRAASPRVTSTTSPTRRCRRCASSSADTPRNRLTKSPDEVHHDVGERVVVVAGGGAPRVGQFDELRVGHLGQEVPGTVGTDHVGQLSANQQDRDRQAHGSPFEVLGAQLRVVPRRGHHGRIPVPVPASVSQAQIPLQALGTARLVAVRQILGDCVGGFLERTEAVDVAQHEVPDTGVALLLVTRHHVDQYQSVHRLRTGALGDQDASQSAHAGLDHHHTAADRLDDV